MNDEFKKLSQGDVTRYVLENATGMGSGSVASMPMSMGGMQRRKGNNLIAQEADKKTVPASTPRNFVAKNAKTAGAGAHKDKSKTIPRKEKHKKPYMEALQAQLDQLKSKVEENTQLGELSIDTLRSYVPKRLNKAKDQISADPSKRNIEKAKKATTQDVPRAMTRLKDPAYGKQGAAEGSEEQWTVTVGTKTGGTSHTMTFAGTKEQAIKKAVARFGTSKNPVVKAVPAKQGVAEGFNGEYDDEAGMAQSNLLTTARAVMGLLKTIKDRDNLPEWGQEKIAKAEMMLVSVWDYLQSQKAMGNDPQQGVAEGDAGLSKDAETNFHAKLDQLVHATFGKRKSEQGMEEGDHEGMYSPEAIKMGNHFIKEFNLIDDMDQQLAIEIVDNCLDGGLTDPNQIRKQVIKYLKQSGTVIQSRKQGVAEGAKVDRQAKHITASMMKKGKSKKDAESIAWAHIKHPKNESVDPYFESLQQMVERQLEPTMDLDAWNNNFQNADPNKYHQFKNKTPEKKK